MYKYIFNIFSITLLLGSLTFFPTTHAIPWPWPWPWPWPDDTPNITIVDLLSSNAEFAPLIKSIQRAALIPFLNQSQNITLVAPIADAIKRRGGELDRKLLEYHIFNQSILSGDVEGEIVLESILKISSKSDDSHGVGIKLEKKGDSGRAEGIFQIGPARVVKSDWRASNGVIQVVDKVLDIPSEIREYLRTTSSLSFFDSLMEDTEIFPEYYTLFAPQNEAFQSLSKTEFSYLKTKFGTIDRENLLGRHATFSLLYRQDLLEQTKAKSFEGEQLVFQVQNGTVIVDGSQTLSTDIIARNGVLHTISKLLVPSSVIFTPLKYLYGMHNFNFATNVISAGYEDLLNDSSIKQTVFAVVDKAFDNQYSIEWLAKEVKYNFLDAQVDVDELKDGQLLSSKMTLNSMNGEKQVLKVSVRNDGSTWLNDLARVEAKTPVRCGNTLIYNIESSLPVPGPVTASGLTLSSTRSFQHWFTYSFDKNITRGLSGLTIFVPNDVAWKNLGLVEKYLLLPVSKKEMEDVLLQLVLHKVVYARDIPSTPTSIPTLAGKDIEIYQSESGQLHFGNANMTIALEDFDVILSNGVAHSISEVPIPSNIIITPQNLIDAGESTRWVELLEKYSLTTALDLQSNYTILVPTDKAITGSDITEKENTGLRAILESHIIPPEGANNIPIDLLSDKGYARTLSGRTLSAERVYENIWTLHVGDSEQSLRVLDQGRTSNGAQVILIDSVIFTDTDPLRSPKTVFAIVLAIMLALIALLVILVWMFRSAIKRMKARRERKNAEPLFAGGEETAEDVGEDEPLLQTDQEV